MNNENGLRVYGISGRGFSGSTLLSLLLGSHSKIFSTGEAYRAFQIYRHLFNCADNTNFCAMHYTECDFWTAEFRAQCDDADLDFLYERIERYDPGKKIVVHSFKHPDLYADMLQRSLRVNGLIVLFKHPVSYYTSVKVHLGQSVSEACGEYVEKYTQIIEMCNAYNIPMFPLFYDDLATRTGPCLKSLCEWMGMVYEPGMIEPWKVSEKIHMVGGNTGAFMHMWNDPVRDWVLNSDTWKETYSSEHEKWIEENYRTITLDEKWRSLPPDDIAGVRSHEPCSEVFEQLLQMTVSGQ